jgi:alpha-galactosidase
MVAEYTFGPDAAGLDVVDFTRLRRLVNEWRQISDTFFGDFYPLTPYSLAENVWMAWQFDRSDLGCGAVQAFRRAECVYESARFSLKGLDPNAVYRLTDMDHPDSVTEKPGQLLLDEGLAIEMPTAPHAVILKYERQP